MKRWGKSPPPQGRPRGHGKPNPVQDEQGPFEVPTKVPGCRTAARRVRKDREMDAHRNGASRLGQNPAYSV